MKKIYLMPTTKWMEAATEEMMAASPVYTINSDPADEKVEDVTELLSRPSNDLWEEE
jgi:hypothetical protein